jgi:MFS family permease
LNREQRWVLGLASLASFVVILDAMVVATALTAIRRHLGASLADLEWTVNAYTLTFAVLLLTAAALGDRLGRRRVFAVGLAVFAATGSYASPAAFSHGFAAAYLVAAGIALAGAAAGAFLPGRGNHPLPPPRSGVSQPGDEAVCVRQ